MSTLRNKVQLIGNLGADAEIKTLDSGKKVASFSLAINETFKNAKGEKVTNTTWINCVAWEGTASILENYTKKGQEIAVDGKLSIRNYENKEGVKVYVTEVIVEEVLLLGSKSE